MPVIVLVTLFYLKSHPDNHDDYEDVFIDSSQSKYEVVPKSEDKNDTADTKETALHKESKKEPEDSKPKEQTAADKKQTAVAEKEDSANKEEATAAAASSLSISLPRHLWCTYRYPADVSASFALLAPRCHEQTDTPFAVPPPHPGPFCCRHRIHKACLRGQELILTFLHGQP